MNIVVDANGLNQGDRAFRRFTIGLVNSIAQQRPQVQFIYTGAPGSEGLDWPLNVRAQPFMITGFKWLDERRMIKRATNAGAAKMIRLNSDGLSISRLDQKAGTVINEMRFHLIDAGKAHDTITNRYLRPVPEGIAADLSWAAAESIKTQYSAGKSYFLFAGDIANSNAVIELLKAFSIFKKWQQSGMQLVLAGEGTSNSAALKAKLGGYKYRQDVIVLEDLPDDKMGGLAAAAYAILYPYTDACFPWGILLATCSGKALVAADSAFNRSIAEKAAWVDPKDMVNEFGKAMISIYRDETRLHELESPVETRLADRRHMMSAILDAVDE